MENSIDLTEAKEYLLTLIPQAGEILKKYFASHDFTKKSKGGFDFATQADIEVDAFLSENIKKRFPDTNFLTEETAPDDYSSCKDMDNLWIIDPLDGTSNFSRKHPNFAISIGLVNHGVPQLAVVHIPVTGNIYTAQIDQEGAFLNGKRLSVSPTDTLTEAVVACDWAWDLKKRLTVVHWLQTVVTHVRQIKSMGSGVSDLASLAEGRIDAYIHSGLKPWDVAASALLIEKAGGKITTPTGDEWNVFESDMLASNGLLHEQMLELLRK